MEQGEYLMMVLGIGTLIVILISRESLRDMPGKNFFIASYIIQVLAWVCTYLEEYFLPDVLNTMEHTCYALAIGLLIHWVYLFAFKDVGTE